MTIILLSILPPPRSVSITCNSKQTTEFPWASSIEHVNYGLVLGMSTHKGTVIFLEQIIREAASVMHEQMKENKEKYEAVEDPEQTSLEVGLSKSRSFLSRLLSLPSQTDTCVFSKQLQLQLQLGPNDVVRGRHEPIPAIDGLGCPADAQEPGIAATARARADRAGAASGAGDRVPSICTRTWYGRRCTLTSRVGWSRSRSGLRT
jgi:hypothetical protein